MSLPWKPRVRPVVMLAAAAAAGLFTTLVVAPTAHGKVIYPGTELPGTKTCPNGTISWHNDPQEGRVIRTQIQESSGKERCEFATPQGQVSNGQTIYIGWKSKLTAVPSSNDWNNMFQLKCHGTHVANYPLVWSVNGGKLTLWNFEDINGQTKGRQVWQTNLPQNQWFSILLRVVYSEDRAKGSVQLWFNGTQQTFGNGSKTHFGQTWDGANNNMHWGIYRTARINGTQIHDIKKPTVATTFAEANPK